MVSIIYLLAIFNMDNPQNTGILQSKVFKGILYGLGIAIVLFLCMFFFSPLFYSCVNHAIFNYNDYLYKFFQTVMSSF